MDDGSATAYSCAMRFRLFLLAVAVAFAGPALGHDYNVGSLNIGHPWARATPKGAAVAGGYLKITNKGTEADRLIGGSAAFAGRVEIHEMSEEGGVMKMRHLPKGIEIKPGAVHVMFMDLKVPLVKDQKPRPKGTLVFEKAGTVEVEYAVEAVGGSPGEHDHGAHKH